MKKVRYIYLFFIVSLIANSMLAFTTYESPESKQNSSFAELSGILGEKVVVCTNTNESKFFYSSFERLDQEKNQKLKSFAELEKNHNFKYDSKDQNTTSSDFYVTINLKSKYGVFAEYISSKSPDFSSSISSQGPPSVS